MKKYNDYRKPWYEDADLLSCLAVPISITALVFALFNLVYVLAK